jgi:hypothetical protein
MRRHIPDRHVAFRHEDGCLVRTVTGADGRSYTHRCEMPVFEKVAWALDETPADGDGAALDEIAGAERLPHTQVDVTLEFLYERGITDRRHRRNYPASNSTHLDAMIEWHALREAQNH